MTQKSHEKGLEACRPVEEERRPALKTKPHWPPGLQLSAKNDMACFIPDPLAVTLSWEAFEQLFAHAYSTASEVYRLGTGEEGGERSRIGGFHLVS